jgi:hypothetical protein
VHGAEGVARPPDAPPRATPAAPRAADAGAEARAVALLRERRIAVEPARTSRHWRRPTSRSCARSSTPACRRPDPVAGSGPPLVVALQAGDACAASCARRARRRDRSSGCCSIAARDANRGDAKGFTPLMAAAMSGCDRVV